MRMSCPGRRLGDDLHPRPFPRPAGETPRAGDLVVSRWARCWPGRGRFPGSRAGPNDHHRSKPTRPKCEEPLTGVQSNSARPTTSAPASDASLGTPFNGGMNDKGHPDPHFHPRGVSINGPNDSSRKSLFSPLARSVVYFDLAGTAPDDAM